MFNGVLDEVIQNDEKDSTITEDKKTASETKIINLNDINISENEDDKMKKQPE